MYGLTRFRISLKNGWEWYIDYPVLQNCLFWSDLCCMKSFSYEILNLLKKWFRMIYRLSNLVELPFLLDLPYWTYYHQIPNLLEKYFRMIYKSENCLFWLDLFHTSAYYHQIPNLLEKYFRMIYRSSCFAELPFLVRCILYYIILSWDSESSKNALEWCIDHPSCFRELPYLVRSIPHQSILSWYSESPSKCFINHPVWQNCLFWLNPKI